MTYVHFVKHLETFLMAMEKSLYFSFICVELNVIWDMQRWTHTCTTIKSTFQCVYDTHIHLMPFISVLFSAILFNLIWRFNFSSHKINGVRPIMSISKFKCQNWKECVRLVRFAFIKLNKKGIAFGRERESFHPNNFVSLKLKIGKLSLLYSAKCRRMFFFRCFWKALKKKRNGARMNGKYCCGKYSIQCTLSWSLFILVFFSTIFPNEQQKER